MGLSNEVIFALVAQGAAKLPEDEVGGKDPGLEPRLHSSGEDQAEWQDFFFDV